MASYLTFYLTLKKESEPVSLVTFSGSNEIYQAFQDSLGYLDSELTLSGIEEVISDLKKNIDTTSKRLTEYKIHAAGNLDIIEEIISTKEYLSELEHTLHKVEFIEDLVIEAQNEWSSYNKISYKYE